MRPGPSPAQVSVSDTQSLEGGIVPWWSEADEGDGASALEMALWKQHEEELRAKEEELQRLSHCSSLCKPAPQQLHDSGGDVPPQVTRGPSAASSW